MADHPHRMDRIVPVANIRGEYLLCLIIGSGYCRVPENHVLFGLLLSAYERISYYGDITCSESFYPLISSADERYLRTP